MATLAPLFFVESSSLTRTTIISRMGSNFSQIQPLTAELSALECLKKSLFCVVATLAPSILIGSSSYLEVTRIAITSRMSSNFDQILHLTAELSALECLKNQDLVLCAFNFDRIFFILGSNKDSHNISGEFEFQPDLTLDCRVICP